MEEPFSTMMFIPVLQQSGSLVTASEQGVVLRSLLAADAHLTRLQLLQWGEGDTEALGSHGWSSWLQVLVPRGKHKATIFSPGLGKVHFGEEKLTSHIVYFLTNV